MRVLVLTAEPVTGEMVRAALGEEAEGAQVLVVSSALHDSPIAFWVSDSDAAIAEAQQVADETAERLEEDGLDAAGDTGESEPLQAIEDALATFAADRILVFSHPEGERAYREEDLEGIEERFDVPVVRSTVSR
ncbi:MAG: hypothetical protein M3141_01880 [Actinomycetota bacterium]|nr:hypothetical protein [Actinomycetota bacterium]